MAPAPKNLTETGLTVSREDDGSQQLVEPQQQWIMPVMQQQRLRQAGVDPALINRPIAPLFWKVDWETLCNLRTQDPKVMASEACVVVNMVEFPEDDGSFDDYIGYIRIEFVTEQGETMAVSHARCYRVDGTYTPLTEWVRAQTIPYALRFGYVATRKEGRHVVRPLPVDIKVS